MAFRFEQIFLNIPFGNGFVFNALQLESHSYELERLSYLSHCRNKTITLKSIFLIISSGFFSKKFPFSVKGTVIVNNKIVLLKNERKEWELRFVLFVAG